MEYKYKTKNGTVVRVFYNKFVPVDENHFGTMSWHQKVEHWNAEKHSTVLKDDSGKMYFMYNDEKIFVCDFLAYEPAELIKLMQDKSTNIFHEELLYTLMKYGINSIHVMQKKKPMTGFVVGGAFFGFEDIGIGEDKSNWDDVEYKFAETDMFKLSDNYKIKLTPADENNLDVYASRDYYVRDLFSLLTSGTNEFTAFENKVA